MTTPTYQTPAPASSDYPGKTLGIVGLVLVLVGLVTGISTIVGLILSHIGFSQSKKAGFPNGPAKAGIIVGWILIGLGIIVGIIVAIVLAATASALLTECANLGPGVHDVNGVHLTCS